jgi:hypothetical protein
MGIKKRRFVRGTAVKMNQQSIFLNKKMFALLRQGLAGSGCD